MKSSGGAARRRSRSWQIVRLPQSCARCVRRSRGSRSAPRSCLGFAGAKAPAGAIWNWSTRKRGRCRRRFKRTRRSWLGASSPCLRGSAIMDGFLMQSGRCGAPTRYCSRLEIRSAACEGTSGTRFTDCSYRSKGRAAGCRRSPPTHNDLRSQAASFSIFTRMDRVVRVRRAASGASKIDSRSKARTPKMQKTGERHLPEPSPV